MAKPLLPYQKVGKVWEQDAGVDDLIFISPKFKIEHDNALHTSFTITQKCIDEAKDFYIFDTETQQYYIEAFMLELQGNNYITAKHQGSERKSGVTAVKVAKNVVGKKDCGGKFCIDKNSPNHFKKSRKRFDIILVVI